MTSVPHADTAPAPLRMVIRAGIALIVGGAASMAAIALVDLVALLNTVLLVEPRARVQWESVPGFVAVMTILGPRLAVWW
ncbi:hypothetical protein [Roseovarius atlanticus]|nr:hypothetical protein [Roseovarius atlanticus]